MSVLVNSYRANCVGYLILVILGHMLTFSRCVFAVNMAIQKSLWSFATPFWQLPSPFVICGADALSVGLSCPGRVIVILTIIDVTFIRLRQCTLLFV